MNRTGRRLATLTMLLLVCWGGGGCANSVVWHKADDLNAGLPAGIEVFRGTGDGLRAVYARFEGRKNPALAWRVAVAGGQALTPLDFSQSMAKQPYIVVNGGYFDKSSSMSLVVSDGVVQARGISQISRDGQRFYPARATFGQLSSGAAEARWVNAAGRRPHLYAFDAPPNEGGAAPTAAPAGGVLWHPETAIGGGPMLVWRGVRQVTAVEEMFDAASGVGVAQAAPRTAVATLKGGAMLIIVVDGRSSHSRGVTLDELADMLVELGAWEAVNLDGGGSSAMVVNGVVANRPSDAAGMRKVRSVLMVTDK
ncbi:phosphodiester glycosidase family protein [Massilia glaciei]|uniref:Phosphodiester glycosidase family protein n=1 Tax=Massilia glaciei TaxID=1524097 RepID=A0A2U2HMJ4_9BURK|nr:phosphodiester glycosidase family protein [Massilia glaciei]PWF48741.1 phosphodiester glycosidase family protein [Massilia glaciei]